MLFFLLSSFMTWLELRLLLELPLHLRVEHTCIVDFFYPLISSNSDLHNRALSWHVHPPTSFCLARHFLHMLPSSPVCSPAVRHDILEFARFLTELSVIDYFFVTKRASSTALAALLNAMDTVGTIDFATRMEFVRQLKGLDEFDPYDHEIEECRVRLRELYLQGGYSRAEESQQQPVQAGDTRTETISPVCVATAFDPQNGAIVEQQSKSDNQGQPTNHNSDLTDARM